MQSKPPNKLLKILLAMVLVILIIAIAVNRRQILFHSMNIISEPYDKSFYEKNFVVENGVIYRVGDESERFPVLRSFSDGFEDAAAVRDLVGIERGWTQLTLMSPQAPTIPEFNDLSHQILLGEGDFLDNRVEPSAEQAHSGFQSLKAVAVAPENGMSTTKASLHTLLLHNVKGDDVWFSAWYYIEEAGEFITMMDLESTFVRGWPGMRIRLQKGYLDLEFAKWEPKRVYRQPENEMIPFPLGQWVFVKAHLYLSENDDGIIQLWQDERLIIDSRGQTLPFAEAVYDSLEIGLSAYSAGIEPAIIFVDDVLIYTE